MDATNGVAVHEPSTELLQVLDAFERTTGFQLSLRPLSEPWTYPDGTNVVPSPFHEHRSEFCVAQKAKSLAACKACDWDDLAATCAPAEGPRTDSFVRTCHAGADEILVPIWTGNDLTAVLFVGQFVRQSRAADGPGGLRVLKEAKQTRLLTLTLLLRSYIRDSLRRIDASLAGRVDGRRHLIEMYIRESLSSGPQLSELARRLALSPSRTSHVVREVTGTTFNDLVSERRLMVAKARLSRTGSTIAWIAAQTGFRDVGYFYRFFKQRTGMTPSTYRERYRIAPQI